MGNTLGPECHGHELTIDIVPADFVYFIDISM